MIILVEDLTAALSGFHPKARLIPDTVSVFSTSPSSTCIVDVGETVDLQQLKSSLEAAIEDCDNLKDELKKSRAELATLKLKISQLIK